MVDSKESTIRFHSIVSSRSSLIGEQPGPGSFQNRYSDFSPYRRKVFKELDQRGTAFEIVEEE